uniref:Aa_trans domain-containing protein n=1 Tax=Heterorhabditis bacteriophora TaxID=37862 RepID=A0A1I7WXI6_HETBA
MESVCINADWQFIRKHPFGFLMLMQTVSYSLFTLVSFIFTVIFYFVIIVVYFNGFFQVLQLSAGINLFVPCTLWFTTFIFKYLLEERLIIAALSNTTYVLVLYSSALMEGSAPQFSPASTPGPNPV